MKNLFSMLYSEELYTPEKMMRGVFDILLRRFVGILKLRTTKLFKKITLGLLCIASFSVTKAQDLHVDSLARLSYHVLDEYFSKEYVDTVKDLMHARAYLKKAKQNDDLIKKANAYFYFSKISAPKKAIQYLDSIIDLTENLNQHKFYPTVAFLNKGVTQYNLGEYEKALENYLTAIKYAKKNKNIVYELVIKSNIAILKQMTGELEQALNIHKEYVRYIDNHDVIRKNTYLMNGLYHLAESYLMNQKFDSAYMTINKGYPIAKQEKNSLMLGFYYHLAGAYWYKVGNYEVAIDSLLLGKSTFNDEELHSYLDFYLGKSYWKRNEKSKALNCFLKVDDFILKTSSVNLNPSFIEIYEPLIQHFKENRDLGKSLFFLNRYLKVDSLLNIKNKKIKNKITHHFEIPNAVAERDKIISQLEKKSNRSFHFTIGLVLFSGLLLSLVVYTYSLNRKKDEKFNVIIEKLKNSSGEEKVISSQKKENAALPDVLTQEILEKLKRFETSNRFLKKYTLPSLAKELKTNGTYLSKVINAYKGTNFANYLNNLKIDYVVTRLNNEKKFRAYTIEAIAKEAGFNTAQSFSKAFQKKIGLKPSYFINRIEKTLNN